MLFEHPKGWCIGTPYHPFNTPWKIQDNIYFCFHFTDELRITYESPGVLNPAASCRVFVSHSNWFIVTCDEHHWGCIRRSLWTSRKSKGSKARQWEVIGVPRGCNSVVLTSWVFLKKNGWMFWVHLGLVDQITLHPWKKSGWNQVARNSFFFQAD